MVERERDPGDEGIEQAGQRRPDRRHARSRRLACLVQGPNSHNPVDGRLPSPRGSSIGAPILDSSRRVIHFGKRRAS